MTVGQEKNYTSKTGIGTLKSEALFGNVENDTEKRSSSSCPVRMIDQYLLSDDQDQKTQLLVDFCDYVFSLYSEKFESIFGQDKENGGHQRRRSLFADDIAVTSNEKISQAVASALNELDLPRVYAVILFLRNSLANCFSAALSNICSEDNLFSSKMRDKVTNAVRERHGESVLSDQEYSDLSDRIQSTVGNQLRRIEDFARRLAAALTAATVPSAPEDLMARLSETSHFQTLADGETEAINSSLASSHNQHTRESCIGPGRPSTGSSHKSGTRASSYVSLSYGHSCDDNEVKSTGLFSNFRDKYRLISKKWKLGVLGWNVLMVAGGVAAIGLMGLTWPAIIAASAACGLCVLSDIGHLYHIGSQKLNNNPGKDRKDRVDAEDDSSLDESFIRECVSGCYGSEHEDDFSDQDNAPNQPMTEKMWDVSLKETDTDQRGAIKCSCSVGLFHHGSAAANCDNPDCIQSESEGGTFHQ